MKKLSRCVGEAWGSSNLWGKIAIAVVVVVVVIFLIQLALLVVALGLGLAGFGLALLSGEGMAGAREGFSAFSGPFNPIVNVHAARPGWNPYFNLFWYSPGNPDAYLPPIGDLAREGARRSAWRCAYDGVCGRGQCAAPQYVLANETPGYRGPGSTVFGVKPCCAGAVGGGACDPGCGCTMCTVARSETSYGSPGTCRPMYSGKSPLGLGARMVGAVEGGASRAGKLALAAAKTGKAGGAAEDGFAGSAAGGAGAGGDAGAAREGFSASAEIFRSPVEESRCEDRTAIWNGRLSSLQQCQLAPNPFTGVGQGLRADARYEPAPWQHHQFAWSHGGHAGGNTYNDLSTQSFMW